MTVLQDRRRRWFEHHYQMDPDDPTRHDLLVNPDRYTYEQAVEVVLAARQVQAQVAAVPASTRALASAPRSSRQPR
mgnify:CR=1 FL=1